MIYTANCAIISSVRIPLTKYGLPQVIVLPAILLIAMLLCFLPALNFAPFYLIITELILAIILIWTLSFFRDPPRNIPADKAVLLAPADGKITNIETVDADFSPNGRAIKISIFLSIFNVHINRAPCAAAIEKIIYKPGRYKNAMNPQSSRLNESNDIHMVRLDEPKDKLIVRQISGAIARRIVCDAKPGQKLAGGQRFGMIKFGSRTELYVPADSSIECRAKIGDKVKAGLTILARYE